MLGACFGILYAADRARLEAAWAGLPRRPMVALALLTLAAFFLFTNVEQRWIYVVGIPLVEVAALTLVVELVLSSRGPLRDALSHPWLVWLGTLSYGLYLWHYPIFRTLLAHGVGPVPTMLFGALLSVAAAWLSHRLVERHFLEIKSRFVRLPATPASAACIHVGAEAAGLPGYGTGSLPASHA